MYTSQEGIQNVHINSKTLNSVEFHFQDPLAPPPSTSNYTCAGRRGRHVHLMRMRLPRAKLQDIHVRAGRTTYYVLHVLSYDKYNYWTNR